ncbi:MAG: winged helix-turn-helix transcriptional regulator [Pyrobaculum sp.]
MGDEKVYKLATASGCKGEVVDVDKLLTLEPATLCLDTFLQLDDNPYRAASIVVELIRRGWRVKTRLERDMVYRLARWLLNARRMARLHAKKLTKRQISEIYERVKQGESITSIAKSLGVTSATVRYYLRKLEKKKTLQKT